jgi:hypothetical protein
VLRDRGFWLLLLAMLVIGTAVVRWVPSPYHLPVSAGAFVWLASSYARRLRRREGR